MRWRDEIEKVLYGPRAMRFVSTPVLLRIAQDVRPTITDNTLHSWINEMTEAGKLVKVYRSFYANKRAYPPVVPARSLPVYVSRRGRFAPVRPGCFWYH